MNNYELRKARKPCPANGSSSDRIFHLWSHHSALNALFGCYIHVSRHQIPLTYGLHYAYLS